MESIEFKDLNSHHCALLDATSVHTLVGLNLTRSVRSFSSSPSPPYDRMTPRLLHALDVLARFVVYDFTVVDDRALRSLRLDAEDVLSLSVIRTVDIPRSAYEEIESQIRCAFRYSRARDPLLDQALSAKTEPLPQWYEQPEREYHDSLGRHGFAASNDSVQRTLFYLELSRLAGITAFVSHKKQEFLQFLGEGLRDVFKTVEHRVDTSMRAAVTGVLGDSCQSFTMPVPPLVEYIWRYSYDNKLSLVEGALALHDSTEAQGFRRWLMQIERKLRSGGRAGEIEAAAQFKELDSRVEEWSSNFDMKLGTVYENRTAKLEAIPVIGWILELAGCKFKMKDPLLMPPKRYVSFISNWYKRRLGPIR